MFPIPSLSRQLEQEWASELATHLRCVETEFRANLVRHLDYPNQRVRVELMDGSFVEFRRAFALVSEERRAIAVFTAHCGHHLFPYHEARVVVDGKVAYEQRAV